MKMQICWREYCSADHKKTAQIPAGVLQSGMWGENCEEECGVSNISIAITSQLFGLNVFFAFFRSKFLINLRRQFRVRKIFRMQVFARFAVFSFCV